MDSLWQEALANLEKVLTPQTFTTWLKPIRLVEIKKDSVILEVPDRFFLDWLRDNYLPIITEALSTVSSGRLHPEFRLQSRGKKEKERETLPRESHPTSTAEPTTSSRKVASDTPTSLNPRYTFSTFVCGSSNQFAHAAALAVANKPASNYNPLFIYGGVGLGKTHLLCAIGNQILAKNPKAQISYYSAEKFMNELINSLRYNKMEQFRNKFRNMDVLLIDDVQFIAGKERTQEEFFHTFNSLHESHKQIVVTSDKVPREMPGLEERLRSRFEWGLIADIQAPDIETKIAILKKKAEQNKIPIPDDVALFLASSSSTNIRELEGMLIRLGAYASLTGSVIGLSMTREVLKDIIADRSRDITVEMIQKQVAEYFKIKVMDLKSEKRQKNLIIPRQIAIYLCRDLTKSSYPEIGEKFGGKDHSTIIHSFKKIERLLISDFELKGTVEILRKGLIS
jgi:chromosomal replication initiator protein